MERSFIFLWIFFFTFTLQKFIDSDYRIAYHLVEDYLIQEGKRLHLECKKINIADGYYFESPYPLVLGDKICLKL
ncbi:MAG: hypothetical protein MJB14_22000 [Spirochaetes bacterium]|nr:hypothetical protein [Spirochaetota bacterium]